MLRNRPPKPISLLSRELRLSVKSVSSRRPSELSQRRLPLSKKSRLRAKRSPSRRPSQRASVASSVQLLVV